MELRFCLCAGSKKLCWWDTNEGVIAEILMMRSIIKNEYPKLVVMSIANPWLLFPPFKLSRNKFTWAIDSTTKALTTDYWLLNSNSWILAPDS